MKKGFTLIELLAVIVILAIIAVIAVPIVLNIINETKNNATLRSAEMYLDAVEMAVANRVMHQGAIDDASYPIMNDGNICLENYDDKIGECKDKDENPDNNVLEVEVNGETPTSGTIIIENGEIVNKLTTDENEKIKLVISGQTITKNEQNEFVIENTTKKEDKIEIGKFSSICKIASDSAVLGTNVGAKYNCKVDPNEDPYTFYVLTTPSADATSINLIMDRNIVDAIMWNNKEDNSYGPITVVTKLYNETKTWTNLKALNYTYNDSKYNEWYESYIGYKSFVSIEGKATITSMSDSIVEIGTNEEPLRTRLPIVDELGDGSNSFLYYNLNVPAEEWDNPPLGYWTLSSSMGDYQFVYSLMIERGIADDLLVGNSFMIGIRPVITLNF